MRRNAGQCTWTVWVLSDPEDTSRMPWRKQTLGILARMYAGSDRHAPFNNTQTGKDRLTLALMKSGERIVLGTVALRRIFESEQRRNSNC